MAKKFIVVLLLGFVATLAGCWWFAEHGAADEGDGYTLVPVDYGRAADAISATGVVQPRDVYVVGSELPGRVVDVRADYNQEVAEGDLLARLDDAGVRERLKQAELGVQEAQAGLRQAESAHDAASTAVQRVKEQSTEIRRQIDLDVVQHQLKSAEAGVEAARIKVQLAEEVRRHAGDDIARTEIRAPVLAAETGTASGVPGGGGLGTLAPGAAAPKSKHTFTILDRAVSVNQIVGPPASARLFTLAGGLEQMRIDVQVAEGDVGRVTRGQTAEVKGPGGDDRPAFAGRVEDVRLTPSAEHGAVFYTVVVGVRNERDADTHDWRLRPGMTANVDILLRVHEAVWKMPVAALTFQPDPSLQSDAARAKLARWQQRKDAESWRTVWVLGADRKPWPLFVRTGGRDARGQTGIQTTEYSEVLEWDPDVPSPSADDEASYPRVVIAAPPPKRSFFTPPKIKL